MAVGDAGGGVQTVREGAGQGHDREYKEILETLIISPRRGYRAI